MSRIETTYINSNARVNERVERAIKVLEDPSIDPSTVLDANQMANLKTLGAKDYLEHLYTLRRSFAEDGGSEE